MLIVVLLAVSVSLDTLGVAMAYGMAGIAIPGKTRLLISVINGVLTAASIWIGCFVCREIPTFVLQVMGAAILVILGVKTLWSALRGNRTTDYDKDASRVIELREGCVVGVVFALDSVSAALGILDLGVSLYVFPACTAVLCYIFLLLGGKYLYHVRRLNGISGIILIVLGLLRLCPDFF